jgi:hypothetical protein
MERIPSKMHRSAKVIVHALTRRVRAMTTLSKLLQILSKKPHPIPIHHQMKQRRRTDDDDDDDNDEDDPDSSNVRLINWIPVQHTNNDHDEAAVDVDPTVSSVKKGHIRIYEATLKDGRSSRTMTARVKIDLARYPSVPPCWQIQQQRRRRRRQGTDGDGDGPVVLYNEDVARLERHINHDVDEFVVPADQTTYDWILVQQLHELVQKWEDDIGSR